MSEGMIRMPAARVLNRWLLRPVMLLLAVAQLVVLVAPSFDRADDRDIGIHLETEGTRQHYVHDDAACPACQTQHLTGRVEPRMRVIAVAELEPNLGHAAFIALPSGRDHHPDSPRAPPVDRAV